MAIYALGDLVPTIAPDAYVHPDAVVIGNVTLMAGASAVQVGTANFADPRATVRVLDELARWCDGHGVATIAELIGAAHPSA